VLKEKNWMSWKIEIKPNAERHYLRLDKKTKKPIKDVLLKLEKEENPFIVPSIKALTGELKGDFRLRVGNWRVLFTPDEKDKILLVYTILPRGKAY
jgi:mRNA interferase RelE/StbE